MHCVRGEDAVIDRLLTGEDELCFNLIWLIREAGNALFVTDKKSYLLAQSNPTTPVWLYIKGELDPCAKEELSACLADILRKNPEVCINAQETFARQLAPMLLQKLGGEFLLDVHTHMNVYVCEQVACVPVQGQCVRAETRYIPDIKQLIQQMSEDAEHVLLSDEEAGIYAQRNAKSPVLFLWKDKEQIVAMARIAHMNEKYARINTVVTKRNFRNQGYAQMLVSNLCDQLLSHGITPMLYADKYYPASNAAYQKVGFRKVGEVLEYQCKL